jgi:hypothetical protein
MDEGVHAARVLGRDISAQIEIPHFPGNTTRKSGSVKLAQRPDTGLPRQNIPPRRLNRIAHRTDDAQAGHNYSAMRHLNSNSIKGSLETKADLPVGPRIIYRHANTLLAFRMRQNVIDRLLNRRDFLGFLVGDFALELLFERYHQFHDTQGIRAQVFREGRFLFDVGFIRVQLLGHDLLDARNDLFSLH